MPKRLAPGSLRDTDWQAVEYERLMGAVARARQELAGKLEHGQCTCHKRVLRTRNGYRTVHQRDCVKHRPWMDEYLAPSDPNAEAHARAIRSGE